MRALATIAVLGSILLLGCEAQPGSTPAAEAPAPKHRSNIPPLHPNNIVSIATKSEDHTTLVAAIQAADYVTSVAASGPLTVFAPTNAAFEALPAGTVEGLLEPEKADALREILKYHVTTSALDAASFRDGQSLSMANGARATIRVAGGTVSINDAKVIASVRATNGMLHVIDGVLLPPQE